MYTVVVYGLCEGGVDISFISECLLPVHLVHIMTHSPKNMVNIETNSTTLLMGNYARALPPEH